MSQLSVHFGGDARAAMCRAFDRAHAFIDAEFYSIDDPAVIGSLNRAAERGVRVRIVVEGDPRRYDGDAEPSARALRGGLVDAVDVRVSRLPHELVHGKAAVIDADTALVSTANVRPSGFFNAGEVLVVDRDQHDVDAVDAKIGAATAGAPSGAGLRAKLDAMFAAATSICIAVEDISDARVVARLAERARAGFHDLLLIGPNPSSASAKALRKLVAAHVDVRVPPRHQYMHEKYVDSGDRIYVGSANLTHNGIDEAYEVGIVSPAADFGEGARMLRDRFRSMWSHAVPWNSRSCSARA